MFLMKGQLSQDKTTNKMAFSKSHGALCCLSALF